ncbi:MAG: DUF3604 domain-containing protein [Hyphomicrobiales bacterium]|nr:MAG: DUF3604 domain-containing protein [Hyphomicrobiales bacterium]
MATDGLYGEVDIAPRAPIVAGSFASLTLTYTAGLFGIDDTGALRFAMRYATDMALPQFDRPAEANYVTVEASNGALLELRYEPRGNRRPFDRSFVVRVLNGFLRRGDTIVLRLGDNRFGSPGIRFQTAAEKNFRFRVAVDAMAAGVYTEIEGVPLLEVVAGAPAGWKAVLPTIAREGSRVRLGVRAEDAWGNPCPLHDGALELDWSASLEGVPARLPTRAGARSAATEFAAPRSAAPLQVTIRDADGAPLATSNVMQVVAPDQPLALWGDLHGQSEETMGLNSAQAYFAFARDIAFLDVTAHQGIDFQMTNAFYAELNRLTRTFNAEDRFVTLPGYEWAGNTGLGGDRNVFFAQETDAFYRSSHAVVPDLSDAANDVHTAADLFQRLRTRHAGTAITFAHVGGRYADIVLAHDEAIERSVEIHSTWGTFEWLAHDAFDAGYRVGIVCNSDDHKGRQGAAHPGASNFGAYGGLTCIRAPRLSREAVFDALKRRAHYGTTGMRIHLDVLAAFTSPVELIDADAGAAGTLTRLVRAAPMGSIVRTEAREVEISASMIGTAPIERVEVRTGKTTVATFRPDSFEPNSRRVRITWEGAEYRGRGRQTKWDGNLRVVGNRMARALPVNFINPEKKFETTSGTVAWESTTTGNAAGLDLYLEDADAGTIELETPHTALSIPVTDLAHGALVTDLGGLGRKLSVQKLPERLAATTYTLRTRVRVGGHGDTPIWLCVIQEDGHKAWSSPIYVTR